MKRKYLPGFDPIYLFLLFVGALLWAGVGAVQAADEIDNETCMMCHGDPQGPLFVDLKKFEGSIHGGFMCSGCHSDVTEIPHPEKLKPVACGDCHGIEQDIYLKSDHKQMANREQATSTACLSCHGDPHTLLDSRNPLSPVFRRNIPGMCAGCHEKQDVQNAGHGEKHGRVGSYLSSVHGLAQARDVNEAAVCTDCHGAHDINSENNTVSKLYWQNIPRTCGKCHENVYKTYSISVHGQGVARGDREAPVCTDCHGEHAIDATDKATSKVFAAHMTETCSQCHAAERIITKYNLPDYVVKTYNDSYHGLSSELGSMKTANCASCHGFHNILPHTDPRSTIYPGNLAKTCGKCHAGVGDLVAVGKIHSGRGPGVENRLSGWVRKFYLVLIFLVIGFMLVHNLFDFVIKLRHHYAEARAHGHRIRMNLNERIQHGFLALSFIALAYSGFALKYPNAWWAGPFAGHVAWRSGMHRAGAAIFGVLMVYHLWYILFTKRGRWHLIELLPRPYDLTHMMQTLQYYVGRRKKKPVFRHYSYIEKMEYWALVWGAGIMSATGVIMLNQAWFLNYAPKWVLDVVTTIHYYEAVLACLAILLWHGYFVMYDPEEYPMKWTWLSGYESHADKPRRPHQE